MRSWWGKSSSKETKKKTTKESFIDTLHRKFKSPSESKSSGRCGRTPRCISDTVSELGSLSRAESRSPSPSKSVARCQSFNDRPAQAQPLPLPNPIGRTDSGLSASGKPRSDKGFKASSFLPLPRPACIRHKPDPGDLDGELIVASISSECSIESEDQPSLMPRSPFASATGSPSSKIFKERSPAVQQVNLSPPTKRRPFVNHMPNLQVPQHGGAFFSAPGSPLRAFNNEQLKPYPDFPILGSGHCSSPGSGHNSMGGDMLFWQPSRGSPEYSPIPSPGPSSRIHSGAVTPLHPRAGCGTPETGWPDDGKQQSHRLPLPPVTISNSSPFPSSNSAATSPSVPRSPGRAENLTSPSPRWKKGKLLGRGTFGHVYEGFNSESGEMCAMKEVTLFSDDPKSKESAKQLAQEIAMLSRLRHQNIVQYYGSEMVGDRLYIYLEYVSGGSIYKLLQQYGEFGESAIRSYTRQILSGLAYLHAKNTVHRDIKGANILVDPNGRIKLADFGMAKHITGQSCPLSFKGSPYWMAPEVIKNSSGANLAVDIWSLGCTVLEMATSKPPWSQYEGVAAMFKIGNSKELPAIPDHLSEEGKDFVKLCLQRDPYRRPTAAKLLVHSFVRNAATMEKPSITATSSLIISNGGIGPSRNGPASDSERLAIHSSRISKSKFNSSDIMIPRNISCPVSPIGSPLLHARSPQHLNGRLTPSPISSPRTTSPTRLTGGGTSTTLPSQHHNSPVFANMPKPSYWDLDGFRGVHTGGTHAYSEQDAKQFQRPTAYREFYDGQSVLADRVSQQLLKDHVKFTPSLDLNPSPLTGRTNGL